MMRGGQQIGSAVRCCWQEGNAWRAHLDPQLAGCDTAYAAVQVCHIRWASHGAQYIPSPRSYCSHVAALCPCFVRCLRKLSAELLPLENRLQRCVLPLQAVARSLLGQIQGACERTSFP